MTTTTTPLQRLLGGLVILGCIAYAGGGVWMAAGTHHDIALAAPDEDLSLYGVGYLFAVLLAAGAVLTALIGGIGWRRTRVDPAAGTVILIAAASMGALPLWWIAMSS